ncbi:glycosyltransferase [Butyrivibrio sp. X503]|uniref:glycosyltransferase family 2 protein n=1 Tax=Butyrivibrio sp. X503 TaxID=2364878 RepID=UPI000EA90E49|nr:glycosyltransferase family 2 protein [Butyrivibrio sp. X503]RKM54241.1 glycosyltransferase [Butyrivibrio sp. X503]
MKLLSVVVPCYNEQDNIADFYNELLKNESFFKEKDIELEIIYIDDGSSDNTQEEVKSLNEKDKRVHLVSFSRNFGKEAAMYAGLQKSKGDYVVIMDCDLQDPPALLPEMINAVMDEGYDSVATRRVSRKGEPPIRSFFARMFYRLINKISNAEIVDGARDYRLMTRKFVDAVLSMEEYNRFSKGIFGWVGFKNKWIEFENIERRKGETKWSFWKLFTYAIDGIVAFSTTPLTIASVLGMLCCFVAFIFVIFIVIRQLTVGDPNHLAGWASMASIILFVGGLQLFFVGVVGQYLSKTYLEVKKRPLYIVKEEL